VDLRYSHGGILLLHYCISETIDLLTKMWTLKSWPGQIWGSSDRSDLPGYGPASVRPTMAFFYALLVEKCIRFMWDKLSRFSFGQSAYINGLMV